ncbi:MULTISPECIES: MFS transporter [Streptomyces]|uniref:MFS transporter n=1 Tax=Streptomyces TaxID=1883 RepID=UPI000B195BDE|nr:MULTISPECIES: MFS transporter [unclassified Streptomyces]
MRFREAHDTSRPDAGTAAERPGWAAAVLWLACAAQFMVVLDVSVVNVALPSIQSALGFDAASLQWVVGGYALVFAGFLLLGGRLADIPPSPKGLCVRGRWRSGRRSARRAGRRAI